MLKLKYRGLDKVGMVAPAGLKKRMVVI